MAGGGVRKKGWRIWTFANGNVAVSSESIAASRAKADPHTPVGMDARAPVKKSVKTEPWAPAAEQAKGAKVEPTDEKDGVEAEARAVEKEEACAGTTEQVAPPPSEVPKYYFAGVPVQAATARALRELSIDLYRESSVPAYSWGDRQVKIVDSAAPEDLTARFLKYLDKTGAHAHDGMLYLCTPLSNQSAMDVHSEFQEMAKHLFACAIVHDMTVANDFPNLPERLRASQADIRKRSHGGTARLTADNDGSVDVEPGVAVEREGVKVEPGTAVKQEGVQVEPRGLKEEQPCAVKKEQGAPPPSTDGNEADHVPKYHFAGVPVQPGTARALRELSIDLYREARVPAYSWGDRRVKIVDCAAPEDLAARFVKYLDKIGAHADDGMLYLCTPLANQSAIEVHLEFQAMAKTLFAHAIVHDAIVAIDFPNGTQSLRASTAVERAWKFTIRLTGDPETVKRAKRVLEESMCPRA